MLKFIALVITLSINLLIPAQAEIYSWKDADGNTVYSDQKPSSDATPTRSGSTVNYYSNPTSTTTPTTHSKLSPTDRLDALSEVTEQDISEKMTEQQCQSLFATNCDQVENWLKYALEQCVDDSRCQDPKFLEKKYRPRSLEELQAIARRAGVRNNMQDKKIDQFLNRKYGNQCEVQAQQYCARQRDRNCAANIMAACKDPRGLNDIFARYDNLSAAERKAIVAKAKAIALANGDDPGNYDKLAAGIIDILLSQALLGI
ncbi:DUF4124 domain-containing protein [Oceanicoccus sp. KOV_DT_Chl]|uniref:DUF4124 domain-containing protein n=1 Tax=Oceanicoccus sp. KOV_DT_Chl TaxID=1904639 RepID=UPI000C7A98E5|nr:DUF4124 domain-containing protein [Oceanicoccus sp. KOV_DT_Chl]